MVSGRYLHHLGHKGIMRHKFLLVYDVADSFGGGSTVVCIGG